MITKFVRPPHSLVVIGDPEGAEIPESTNRSAISATESCVAIGCRAEDDGETEILLGRRDSLDPGQTPAFSRRLVTPSGRISIRTVLGETLLVALTGAVETTVTIWVNDDREPNRVIVGFS